ncbi:MAG TPA: hypothetical protein VG983_06775 [Caulobacterales bacterium]|nr:hypothetical protein [Caulobacterales bacterium]
MRRILAAGATAFALMGCASADPGEPAAAQEAERAADAFILQIDTGRAGVFNDRIAQALDLMPGPPEPADETPEATRARDYKTAQDNLRRTWFEFLAVRTRACAEGKFTEIACAPLAPPAWLSESAATPTAPATIVRRLDELQEAMAPLLDAACEEGRRRSTGEEAHLFCSVE